MQLDHVTLRTDDLDATRDFFVQVLGLAVGERPPLRFPGYWLYGAGRPIVHLVPAGPDRGAYLPGESTAGPDDGTGAVDHIAFRGDDYDALIANLGRLGVEHTTRTQRGSDARQVFVAGPHGLVVEINFPPAA